MKILSPSEINCVSGGATIFQSLGDTVGTWLGKTIDLPFKIVFSLLGSTLKFLPGISILCEKINELCVFETLLSEIGKAVGNILDATLSPLF